MGKSRPLAMARIGGQVMALETISATRLSNTTL